MSSFSKSGISCVCSAQKTGVAPLSIPRVRTPKLVHFGATHGADGVPHVRHNHVLDPSTLPCSAMLQQAEQYPSRRSREPASMRSTTHLAASRALSTTSFLFLSASSSP